MKHLIKSGTKRVILILAVGAAAASIPSASDAALTFSISGTWPGNSAANAAAAMQAIVNDDNAYGNFANFNFDVTYQSGVPTAQSSYLSQIQVGGSYTDPLLRRVLQHETNHVLGSGTTSSWTNEFNSSGIWMGTNMNALAAEFDGDGTVIKQSGVHFYPYGLNYDTEVTNIDSAIGAETVYMRNIAILYAERQDDGLGPSANPWSATNVTLTKSDALGTSAFNNWGVWSDGYFTHSGADYSTGNFTIRTPLDTYTPSAATPSFTFAGDSLTINNTNGINGGLLFKGVGTTGLVTFKNLILDGGYVRHASGASDLFQLAGNLTLESSPTIDAAQGNIKILANIAGTGTLNIPSTAFTVTLASPANTYTGNFNVAGRLALAENADMKFAIGTNGTNNAISGSATSIILDGVFDLDLTHADSVIGNAWSLVSSSNTSYGDTFTLEGFTYDAGLWRNGNGFVFSQATGKVSVTAAPVTAKWAGNSSVSWAGNTSWSNAPSTGDALQFGAAGTAGTILTDDLMTARSYSLAGITFMSDAPAYTINPGTAGTNGFLLTAGVINQSTSVQTINDDITVPFQRTTFTTNGGGGDIVVNGNIGGAGGIAKAGADILTLAGANTYTGGTRVDSGTLLLTGSLSSSGALALAGGTFTYANPTSMAQTINGVTIFSGSSAISNSSAGTLALGSITRHGGGIVIFSTAGSPITTSTTNTNDILGPWALVGTGGDARFATNSGGAITGYTGATAVGDFGYASNDTANYEVAGAGGAISASSSANTVRYTGAAGTVTSSSPQNLTFNALMNAGTGELAFGNSSTSACNLGAGSTGELILIAANSGITINDSIFDGANGTDLLVVGPNAVTLNGATSFTGQTTIVGGGTLRITGGSALPDTAGVNIDSGSTLAVLTSETIGALQGAGNVNIAGSQTLTVGGENSDTLFDGNISGGGALIQTGSGTLTLRGANVYSGGTTVSSGKIIAGNISAIGSGPVKVSAGAELQFANTFHGTLVLPAFTVAQNGGGGGIRVVQNAPFSSTSAGGTADLGKTDLLIDYTGADPYAAMLASIRNAYDDGKWGGTGILSSSIVAGTSLAIYDNRIGTKSSFDGIAADPTSVFVKYTWIGDANLDGVVNSVDLAAMSATGTTWQSGDFNYDGKVNADDYALFMLESASSSSRNISELLPEPSWLIAWMVGMLAILPARKRQHSRLHR